MSEERWIDPLAFARNRMITTTNLPGLFGGHLQTSPAGRRGRAVLQILIFLSMEKRRKSMATPRLRPVAEYLYDYSCFSAEPVIYTIRPSLSTVFIPSRLKDAERSTLDIDKPGEGPSVVLSGHPVPRMQ